MRLLIILLFTQTLSAQSLIDRFDGKCKDWTFAEACALKDEWGIKTMSFFDNEHGAQIVMYNSPLIKTWCEDIVINLDVREDTLEQYFYYTLFFNEKVYISNLCEEAKDQGWLEGWIIFKELVVERFYFYRNQTQVRHDCN